MSKDLIKTLTDLRPEAAQAYEEITGSDFTDPQTGEVKRLLDVAVKSLIGEFTGSFSQSGLQNGGKITNVTLNATTWTPLPPIPLTNRNAIRIVNPTEYPAASTSTVIYNYTGLNDGTGVEIVVGGRDALDIKDTIVIYGKSLSGTTTIVVEELS